MEETLNCEVQVWDKFVEQTVLQGESDVANFKAGSLKNHLEFWQEITLDSFILNIVKGAKIEFESTRSQYLRPTPYV